jgi:hypothetical protein
MLLTTEDLTTMDGHYKAFRAELVVSFITLNLGYAALMLMADAISLFTFLFVGTLGFITFMQVIGSFLYLVFKCMRGVVR